MDPLRNVARWLDVRPPEVRSVVLSFIGAFVVISFLVLGRSLREALYLTTFPVETLPYITASVAILSVPTVGLFTHLLSHNRPQRVLRWVLLVTAAGLALLWPFATRRPVAVIAFYLLTALATLLITSGFWVVTSELFPVRGAKRLYGLIGAGGTLGAMTVGSSLGWLTRRLPLAWLIVALIGLLGLCLLTQTLLPQPNPAGRSSASRSEENGSSLREAFGLIWRNDHLRTMALIVLAAAMASALVDYQFKELARGRIESGEGLTGFFGAFYGWTGAISLTLQLLVAARVMAAGGLGFALGILPLVLLLGSAGLLIVPGLVLATLVRGGDNALRKSLHRSAIEVLYVPIPSLTRRKTKTFIDSVVDSVSEGLGAGVVFLWVTLAALPSRYLSIFVICLAAWFLWLSRRMEGQYLRTVTDQLTEKGTGQEGYGKRLEGRDLLSASFTRLDVQAVIDEVGAASAIIDDEAQETAAHDSSNLEERLTAPDVGTVLSTLEAVDTWSDEHIPLLVRLLARDPLYESAIAVLIDLGGRAVPHLAERLRDDDADFVIRRRIPRVLARCGGQAADDALLDALSANRFEIRYRAAIGLVQRRRRGLPVVNRDADPTIWEAIRSEVGRDSPVWELSRLLDDVEGEADELVIRRVGARGERSLEHTFRLLTLVLDPEPVHAAFHGIITEDERLRSLSLEYLEQVLPPDIRRRLWPFIGDASEHQRRKALRPLSQVVSDLVTTDATLFQEESERQALRRMLDERDAPE